MLLRFARIIFRQTSPLPFLALGCLLAACSTGVTQETSGAPLVATAEIRPAAVPAPKKLSYNSVNTDQKVLALTFDDGPHATLTPKLLDLLKARRVKATFYVVGRNVELYPEIAKRIVREGHEIANHTWSHPTLTKLSAAKVSQEFTKTDDAIFKATGVRSTNMRPPYGAINENVRQVAMKEFGYPTILWSVDPLDWKRPGSATVTRRLVDGASPGGILLAHDIHPGTIEAMPATIDQLLAQGYRFATVSELLALDQSPAQVAATPVPVPTVESATGLPGPGVKPAPRPAVTAP